MTNEAFIIFACEIDGSGGAHTLAGEALRQKMHDNVLTWLHLDISYPEAWDWLEKNTPYIDPIIREALFAEETRPRVQEFENGMLMNLRGVNLNENSDPEDMVSIRIWVEPTRIITARRRKLKAAADVHTMLEQKRGPKDSGDFVAMLIGRLFDRMEPVLGELDERTDEVEKHVLHNPDSVLRREIISIRTEAITFRRYIAPQRDVIAHLRIMEYGWLTTQDRRLFQENFDRVTRYLEGLDAIRERSQIVHDELANALTEKLNHNMYRLSVVAAIFLPLSFLTGLLGINIAGIPGAEHPQAFFIFLSLLVIVVVAEVTIFRKKGWF